MQIDDDIYRALLLDALRYRWLRDKSFAQWQHPIVVSQEKIGDHIQYVGPLLDKELDAAIDAAMTKQKYLDKS